MAREYVVRCDQCKAEGAVTYTVEYASGRWRVDLCDNCAAPLLALAAIGVSTGTPREAGSDADVARWEKFIRADIPHPEEGDTG